jgi:hypothetical protein
MDLPRLVVRYGELGQLQGPPRKWGDVTIAAALVALRGRAFSLGYELARHLRGRALPADVRELMLGGYDAPWVRGRIERVFGVTSPGEQERGEKSGLHASFIAVCPQPDGSLLGVPFECHDHYLKSALMFSEQVDPAPADLCALVADAFWGLLLAEPHDLPEYRGCMPHVGAGGWLVFGVEAGRPFIEEYDEEPRDE